MWLRIGTTGRLLWTQLCTFWFRKSRWITSCCRRTLLNGVKSFFLSLHPNAF